jgi:signal transduction histidine kinase
MSWLTGLSARLLMLTVFFVMLSEVLIYAPSIGRYRLVYMQERIAAAHLASLALDAPSDKAVSGALMEELLDHARSYGIVLRRPASKALMLSANMPPAIDATYDLAEGKFFALIWEAFLVLARDRNRVIRIIGVSPKDADVVVETLIDETPMRLQMYDYSGRILLLSIVISLVTASLVYLSLHWLFVRPMLGITQSMVAFRANPEDAGRVIRPGGRRDEIGRAQRELADMQSGLRAALQQRERLAALGTAVTKINHDLRNILATAQIVADTVESSQDPKVRHVAPTLLGAIDRAVKLCGQTLVYAHEGTPAPIYSDVDLAALVDEVGTDAATALGAAISVDNRVPAGQRIRADRDQMYRVLPQRLRGQGRDRHGRRPDRGRAGPDRGRRRRPGPAGQDTRTIVPAVLRVGTQRRHRPRPGDRARDRARPRRRPRAVAVGRRRHPVLDRAAGGGGPAGRASRSAARSGRGLSRRRSPATAPRERKMLWRRAFIHTRAGGRAADSDGVFPHLRTPKSRVNGDILLFRG